MLDNEGVDFLGMRLVVVLVAAALLLSAAAAYVEAYVDRSSRDQARHEASRIVALAGAEYASGCPGSPAQVSVAIPGCVRRMDFNESTYSIEFADGSVETRATGCPFLPVTLYPGKYSLWLEVDENYSISLEALQDARR